MTIGRSQARCAVSLTSEKWQPIVRVDVASVRAFTIAVEHAAGTSASIYK